MQRNGQNPIKAAKTNDHNIGKTDDQNVTRNQANIAGICSACNTEVPHKPGFRASTLKCPKCGKPLGKK